MASPKKKWLRMKAAENAALRAVEDAALAEAKSAEVAIVIQAAKEKAAKQIAEAKAAAKINTPPTRKH